jgi:hypothetical protein
MMRPERPLASRLAGCSGRHSTCSLASSSPRGFAFSQSSIRSPKSSQNTLSCKFARMDWRASCRLCASDVLMVPIAGAESSMNDTCRGMEKSVGVNAGHSRLSRAGEPTN